jgi:hypothetical protein
LWFHGRNFTQLTLKISFILTSFSRNLVPTVHTKEFAKGAEKMWIYKNAA